MTTKRKYWIKLTLLILSILLLVISLIDPIYPEQQLLQHSGTLIILIFLGLDVIKNKWRLSAYTGLLLFCVLHIIGARYIYSFVPYNDWSIDLLGFNFQEYFGYERNHFDRFVHFSFGVLLYPLCFHLYLKIANYKYLFAGLIAWLTIQTFSLFYEVFEWGLTVWLSGDQAENYNGQQGDVWDPQKDMALALLGSTLMFIVYAVKYRKSKRA